MDDRAAVCWLHRRLGLGLAPSDLQRAIANGVDAELDRLLSTDQVATAVAQDPWDDSNLPLEQDRRSSVLAVNTWLDHLVGTTTPAVDRMAWLWHGHFVSALDKVKIGRLMVDQIRLFRSGGLGRLGDLLRSVMIDPAMLVYLDGTDSTAAHPNENFSREVLELFTIGLGGYTEDDVRAGAAALTGWRFRRALGQTVFISSRHDNTRRRYLGVDGVHDVDTVTSAILGHPDLGLNIARIVAGELLGTDDGAGAARLGAAFTDSGFDIAALVRSAIREGFAGASSPIVLAPVPWLAISQRVTGASINAKVRLSALRTAGQVPLSPPNVAGWPGGAAWFGSSTIVARAQLAAEVASAAPISNEAREASDTNDLDRMAIALGLPDPTFGEASTAALLQASPGSQRLALALCTPEFVLA